MTGAVHGVGRWTREADGHWTLLRFRVQSFVALEDASLRDTVTALRSMAGNHWADIKDPLAELDEIRRGSDEMH